MIPPNSNIPNEESGLDDFDNPWAYGESTEEEVEDLEAYLLEKEIDRRDSGYAGV